MANHYLNFSEELTDLTPEEVRWLKHQLEVVYQFEGVQYTEDSLPPGIDPDPTEWCGCRAFRDLENYEPDAGPGPDFGYEFLEEGGDVRLWLHAEDCIQIEQVAHLVQKFLRQFRPDQCWSLTYAAGCTKPRIGEFGGGGVFVTADRVRWLNTHDWIAQRRSTFEIRPASFNPQVAGATDLSAERPQVMRLVPALRINAPQWYARKDFIEYLRRQEAGLPELGRATWHRGDQPTDLSDLFVAFEGRDGSDFGLMPPDIWEELCRLCEEADFSEGVVWISNLRE